MYSPNELIDITIYLGSEENPIIARLGITKKAESYALDMIVYFGLIVPLFSVKPCHYNS